MKTLPELFVHCLGDMYYAEKLIHKELKSMEKKAINEHLKKAFEKHGEETQEHIKRLEQAFTLLKESPKAERCPAIEGIVEEAHNVLKEIDTDELIDIALIGAAQKVEHYEMASYYTMIEYAEILGYNDVVKLLEETVEEEETTDEKLESLGQKLYSKAL